MDIQHFLKLHNSFICRRCLNLVETVEVLEVKLKTTKQNIRDNFIKTLQLVAPDLDPVLKSNVKLKNVSSQKNKFDSSFSKENISEEHNESDKFHVSIA